MRLLHKQVQRPQNVLGMQRIHGDWRLLCCLLSCCHFGFGSEPSCKLIRLYIQPLNLGLGLFKIGLGLCFSKMISGRTCLRVGRCTCYWCGSLFKFIPHEHLARSVRWEQLIKRHLEVHKAARLVQPQHASIHPDEAENSSGVFTTVLQHHGASALAAGSVAEHGAEHFAQIIT